MQDQPATVANFAIVQKDRERTVVRRVDHYNLDVVKAYNIKSVSYTHLVEAQLKSYVSIDWTSFTQRKSLVRVLQYMEKLQMLRVYEGRSEAFGSEAGQAVSYTHLGVGL